MSKISLTPNALGTGTLTIAAPNTSTNRTLTLPDETGTFLVGTQPAGDIVGTTATQTLTNKSIVATQLTGTVAAARLPAGSVLQVVSATKTDTFSRQSSSSDFGDITGLSVSITPTSATSKILIFAIVPGSAGAGSRCGIRLMRDSTAISIADSAGNRTRASSSEAATATNDTVTLSCNFLDSPNTTSATTYKVQGSAEGSQTFYANRASGNSDSIEVFLSTSSITVMEIAA